MTNKKLLIVEDKPKEQANAINAAQRNGFNDIVTASTLEEALQYIPNVQAVATDLFFPAGNVNTEDYVKRILPCYVSREQQSGKLPKGSPVVLKALEKTAALFEMTPEQYVENVVAKIKDNEGFTLNMARASLPGYEQKFDIKQFLKDEENLPIGILVTEEAQKYGIPSVIVTSGGGHGGLLQPIMSLVKVPYETYVVNGQKDWNSGLAKLLSANPDLK